MPCNGNPLLIFNFSTESPSPTAVEEFKFRDIVDDLNLLTHFPAVYAQVTAFRGDNPQGQVLSQCTAGRSRSVSMAVLLLSKAHVDGKLDTLFPNNSEVKQILEIPGPHAFERVMLILDYFRTVQREKHFPEDQLVSPNTGNLLRLSVALHFMLTGGISDDEFGVLKEACLAHVQPNSPRNFTDKPRDPWCDGITGYDPQGINYLSRLALQPMIACLALWTGG